MNLTDDAITLTQAARSLPTRPHSSTVWRWCRQGVRGVRLEYARLGRRIVTTKSAIDKFSRALADVDRQHDAEHTPAPSATPRHRTPAQRERDIEAAEGVLRDARILCDGH